MESNLEGRSGATRNPSESKSVNFGTDDALYESSPHQSKTGPADTEASSRRFRAFPSFGSSSRDGRMLPSLGINRRSLPRKQGKSYRNRRHRDEDSSVERVQSVHCRESSSVEAMGKCERIQIALQRIFCCAGRIEDPPYHGDEKKRKAQYRIQTTEIPPGSWIQRKLTALAMLCCFSSTYHMYSATGGTADNWIRIIRSCVVNSLNWMFRTPITVFLLFGAMMYYALVFFFAGLLYAIGEVNSSCIVLSGDAFGHNGTELADAFELSWTTLSTVGYGHAHPALSDNSTASMCFYVSMVCMIEAFVGVMFASFIGAILFGRISRIQSCAQVAFSDPLLVQYGSGVETFLDKVGDSIRKTSAAGTTSRLVFESDGESDPEKGKTIDSDRVQTETVLPFPILEFRIANRLHNEVGGEIMEATLEAVVALTADDSNPIRSDQHNTANDMNNREEAISRASHLEPSKGDEGSHSIFSSAIASFPKRSLADSAAEDNSSSNANHCVFSSLQIESSFHPSYRRVWAARHVLDETSPLLSLGARRRIQYNGGTWPRDLNTSDKIRENICFDQLLVGLSGISNVSGCRVNALKVYSSVDLVIGFRFVDILYRDNTGKVKVDLQLLNDVKEQRGGGGQQLFA